MTPKTFQTRGIAFLRGSKFGLLQAPTGSGKTFMGLSAVKAEGGKCLWIAPTVEICQQAEKTWGRMGGEGGGFVAKCAQGVTEEDFAAADLIVLDEAHRTPCVTWLELADKTKLAEKRLWGLTATPKHRKEERNAVMADVFGEPHVITVAEVEAEGLIVLPAVTFLKWCEGLDGQDELENEVNQKVRKAAYFWLRDKPDELAEYKQRISWMTSQKQIEDAPARIREIVREAKEGTLQTLILVSTVARGQALAKATGGVFVHSKLSAKVRAKRIEAFKSNAERILIATSLADEGLDLPSAEKLILGSAGHSKTKIPQRIGRIMRAGSGGKKPQVVDFTDEINSIGIAMARNRWKIYKEMGMEIAMKNLLKKKI